MGEHLEVPGAQLLLQHPGGPGRVVHGELQALPALLPQTVGGDALQHPALLNEGVVGGQGGQLGENVAGDQNGGLPLPVQLKEQLPELHDALRVQAVDGLVQEEELRVVHEGQGQAQPLLHAQGEGLELLFPRVRQPHLLQGLVHALLSGNAPLDAVVLQVLPGGEVGVKGGDLHHGSGAGAGPGQGGGGGGPEQGDLPGGGVGLAGDEADEGGLARPVAAHQPENLPLFHGQGGVIQGQSVAVPAGQVPGL